MMIIEDLLVKYKQNNQFKIGVGPIDLKIEEGEIIALIGPSGCGKSTLLNVLAGVLVNYEGRISLNGRSLNHQKQMVGYIPQGYGLLPWKNVYQNCVLPYKVKKQKVTKEVECQIQSVLEVLGLCDLKKRYPHQLSGGQRQRVAIARAFACKPELLLMDEPFSALDAIMKEEAMEAFFEVWKMQHCTSLIVTHSIEEAIYLGKKMIVMGNEPGKVIQIIENPLFGNKDFAEHEQFKGIYSDIKRQLKEAWA